MTKKQISVKQDVNAFCAHFRLAENVAFSGTSKVSTSAHGWGANPVFVPVCYAPNSYVSAATKNTKQEIFLQRLVKSDCICGTEALDRKEHLCFINRAIRHRRGLPFVM